MTAVNVLKSSTSARTSERLDSVLFALYHANIGEVVLYDANRLTSVDLVSLHAVTAKVLNALDGVSSVPDGDLVGLHRFLDLLTDLTELSVDASHFEACLCRFFHCLKQGVVLGVEGNSEGAISHETVNLRAVINLHDIVVLKYRLIADVGCPVRCNVIEACPCRERNASIESVSLNQATICLLYLVRDIHNLHPWPNKALSILSSLAMYLSCAPEFLIVLLNQLLLRSKLRTRDPIHIVIIVMLHDLTNGEVSIWVLL